MKTQQTKLLSTLSNHFEKNQQQPMANNTTADVELSNTQMAFKYYHKDISSILAELVPMVDPWPMFLTLKRLAPMIHHVRLADSKLVVPNVEKFILQMMSFQPGLFAATQVQHWRLVLQMFSLDSYVHTAEQTSVSAFLTVAESILTNHKKISVLTAFETYDQL